MRAFFTLLARSCSVQHAMPVPAGRTRLLSSNMNNKADPAHCRAFVLLIFLTVFLAFFLVVGLFHPTAVGKHRAVLTATPKQRDCLISS